MRMRMAIVVLALLLGGAAQGQQCCGDCQDDGAVTINDLIVAVNNSLLGCGQDTPTPQPTSTATVRPTATRTPTNRCPHSFNTRGNFLCSFRGRFNQGCGGELASAFSSDGQTLVVTLETGVPNPPTVAFAARITSGTTASLTGWSTNNFQTINPVGGTVELGTDSTRLVLFPNDPPFQILSCNFVRYNGSYTGSTRGVAATADNDAFARLQLRQAEPPPELVP